MWCRAVGRQGFEPWTLGLKVDTQPPEGDQLAASEARVGGQVVSGVVRGGLRKPRDSSDVPLLRGVDLILAEGRLVHELADVPVYHTPAHGVLDGLRQRDVDVLDGVGGQAGLKEPAVKELDIPRLELGELDRPYRRCDVAIDDDAICLARPRAVAKGDNIPEPHLKPFTHGDLTGVLREALVNTR